MTVRIDEETIEQTIRILMGYITDLQNQISELQKQPTLVQIFTLKKTTDMIKLSSKYIDKIQWLQEKRKLNIKELQGIINELRLKESE